MSLNNIVSWNNVAVVDLAVVVSLYLSVLEVVMWCCEVLCGVNMILLSC